MQTANIFWQEDAPTSAIFDAVVDLTFAITGKELPVDHASALAMAIFAIVPWVKNVAVGIHPLRGAGSQNGWERPEHSVNNRLILSHRAKLIIRTPVQHVSALERELSGQILNVAGCVLTVGKAKQKSLTPIATLLARHVVVADNVDEVMFLNWVAKELQGMDIKLRKAICGKTLGLVTLDGMLSTRSLLLADLTLQESMRLQQHGLGEYRFLGCGIFIPHKGIAAVKTISG